jgi:hypothetical protein
MNSATISNILTDYTNITMDVEESIKKKVKTNKLSKDKKELIAMESLIGTLNLKNKMEMNVSNTMTYRT